MERQTISQSREFFAKLAADTKASVVSVLCGLKQTAALVKINSQGQEITGLYRPEHGVRISLDPRIPKPQELKRDIAYHLVDSALGWNLSAPVKQLTLGPGDSGVVRPYWHQAQSLPVFDHHLDERVGFWKKVAVLDYCCGVVDRNLNDVLLVDGEILVIDSGLSFVEGKNFTVQNSFIRDQLQGQPLGEEIVHDLAGLATLDLMYKLEDLVPSSSISSLIQRMRNLVESQVII